MLKYSIAAAMLGISLGAGPAAKAEDIETGFAMFRTRDRCSIMVAVLGEPVGTIRSSTLGITHTRVRWVEGQRAYVAVCVMDRLVTKRTCQGPQVDC